jgi:hypothetical protein
MEDSDYTNYRGKCKEFVDEAIKRDPSLIAVRGYYYDAFEGKRAHWWCKRLDGSIFDPTAKQFTTKGKGLYEEFDGTVECSECGKKMTEEEADFEGNYAFCSTACHMKFVGLAEYI